MRIDPSRVLDQYAQETSLRWRQVDHLLLLANLPAREIDVSAILEGKLCNAFVDIRCGRSSTHLEAGLPSCQPFLDAVDDLCRWCWLQQIVMNPQPQRLNSRLGRPKGSQ